MSHATCIVACWWSARSFTACRRALLTRCPSLHPSHPRQAYPGVPIYVRALDMQHAAALQEAGGLGQHGLHASQLHALVRGQIPVGHTKQLGSLHPSTLYRNSTPNDCLTHRLLRCHSCTAGATSVISAATEAGLAVGSSLAKGLGVSSRAVSSLADVLRQVGHAVVGAERAVIGVRCGGAKCKSACAHVDGTQTTPNVCTAMSAHPFGLLALALTSPLLPPAFSITGAGRACRPARGGEAQIRRQK